MSRKVAILVETALASGRAILSGIGRYIHERDDWAVFFHAGPLGVHRPSALRQWRGDGILARISDERVRQLVCGRGVPVVDVLGNLPESGVPLVCNDENAIAQTVAAHFEQRGHRHFAFFGLRGERWSEARRESFVEHCRGFARSAPAVREVSHAEREPRQWDTYFADLCHWIDMLPKPLGLMVASDQLAPDVIEACAHSGHAVPEQVSVVGVDNDVPYCEVCQPRLSSVEPNHERIGYEASRLLDALMRGEPAPVAPLMIPPRLLEVRQSSDATAVDDPVVVRAMRLIRERATEGIPVDEVARGVGVSRSVLQRRFRQHLGQTVNHALVTVRLNRAKEMLAKTELPIAEIADRAGFNHQEYLGHVFRQHLGQTPAQFRKQAAG